MAKLNHILAAVGMTAAAALIPAQANAQSYEYLDCKRSDKDAQVVGGLVGGLIGAVAGHEIAGRGETTEGAVIGGLIGAAAGAGIGDDRRNCTEEAYATGEVRTTGYTVPTTTVSGATLYDAGHHSHRRDRGHFDGWRSSRDVRYRIEQLKAEDRRLKRRARYERGRWIDRRRDEIRWEVKRLKRIEDRLERREREYRRDYRDDRRDYRRDRRDYRRDDYRRDRRGARHYHGSNVCYSDH